MSIYAVNGKEPIAAWIPSLDTGLVDLIGSNDLSLSGSAVIVSSAGAGGSKAIDGTGSTSDFAHADLDISGYAAISFSFWIEKLTNSEGGQRFLRVFHSGADDIRFFSPDGLTAFNFTMDDGSTSGQLTGTVDDQWLHIVGTHDGSTQRLFINGSEVGFAAKTFDYAGAEGGIELVRALSLIDDIRIFDQDLDSTDVTALYTAQRGGNASGIVEEGITQTELNRQEIAEKFANHEVSL